MVTLKFYRVLNCLLSCVIANEFQSCRFEYNAAAEVVKEVQFEEVEGITYIFYLEMESCMSLVGVCFFKKITHGVLIRYSPEVTEHL